MRVAEAGGGVFDGAGPVGVDDEQLLAARAATGADGNAHVAELPAEQGDRLLLGAGVAAGERHGGVLAALGTGGGVVTLADASAPL
jgi:hypothetical protein